MVSIIINLYNQDKYIKECLDSIEKLKNQDYEIIVVNDGSTDKSVEIIKKYQKKYTNIILLSTPHRGKAYAYNKGISSSHGDYVMFVNIKDFIDDTFLDEVVPIMEHEKADIVYTDYYEYYNINRIKLVCNNQPKVLINYEPWAKIYRKSFLIKNKFSFLEDNIFFNILSLPLWLGMAKTCYLPLPLYYSRYIPSSVSFNKNYTDILYALDETIYNFKKHKIYTKYRDELEYLCLDKFLKTGVLLFAKYKDELKYIPEIRAKILDYFSNIMNNKYITKKDRYIYKVCLYTNPRLISFFIPLIER